MKDAIGGILSGVAVLFFGVVVTGLFIKFISWYFEVLGI